MRPLPRNSIVLYTTQVMIDNKPKIWFTRAAFQKMKERRVALVELEKEVMERLKAARAMGDLSENGAYQYAKFELGNIRRELRRLAFLIENGMAGEEKQHYDRIDFGCTFTLFNGKTRLTFMLVSEHESNPAEGKLSRQSPIGRAVYRKQVGETVTVQTPSGRQELEIVSVQ